MKQYSVDLRERRLRAIDAGLSHAEAARLFGVGESTIKRWARRRRDTGSPAPKPRPGRPARIGPEQFPALEARVRAAPDATLAEHCAAWAREQEVRVSVATMSRAIRRLGWTVKKKTVRAAERDEAARAAWRAAATALDPADLVFVDESGTNTAMTPRYARAPRGERAVGSAPRNHGPNVTLLAALTPDGIGPALVVEGAADGPAFALYVAELLVPSLRPGQVVVLDNLGAHTAAAIRELVEGAACRLLFLPTYSPDLNPIEPAFAKIKALRRRAGARTFDALVAAIGRALDAVTAAAARGFFAHRGYPLPEAN